MTSSSEHAPAALAGIQVLDCATFLAAPIAAATLGEFGAEVIKIEQPGAGDSLRRFGTATEIGDTLCWLSESRNKRSITLDLRQEEGAGLFRRLAADADVVCENFRPGTMESWGLSPVELIAENPGLIILRVSGYGQDGPYSDRPGFARIAHAFGGLSYLAGMEGEAPITPGSTSLADYMCGIYGAFAILAALRHRDRTGEGQVIDLALYEPIFRALDEIAPRYAADGTVRGPQGVMTSVACPHGHFKCADGKWIAVACTNDKMFARLAEVMGRPELADADKYVTTQQRLADRETVDGLVSRWLLERSREDVMAILVEGQVPAAPINTIEDIFADPQFAARETLIEREDPDLGPVTIPNVVPRLSGTPGRIDSLGPRLGEANADIYKDRLGLSEAQLAELAKKGVI